MVSHLMSDISRQFHFTTHVLPHTSDRKIGVIRLESDNVVLDCFTEVYEAASTVQVQGFLADVLQESFARIFHDTCDYRGMSDAYR